MTAMPSDRSLELRFFMGGRWGVLGLAALI